MEMNEQTYQALKQSLDQTINPATQKTGKYKDNKKVNIF
jgi:hypothetical protein